MPTTIPCFIAFFSTAAFITLWFGVVRKELKAKQNMIESARSQLAASRAQCLKIRDTPAAEEAQGIVERSHDIYRQSVELYNDALQKPWNAVPAFFLGFESAIEQDIR